MKTMTESKGLTEALSLLEMYIVCGTEKEIKPMREVSKLAQELLDCDFRN